MFILSEKSIGVPISTITNIVITYYSSKCETFDIYNNNFDYDNNMIPLITSLLEVKPIISKHKRYICIDTSVIISDVNIPNTLNKLNKSNKGVCSILPSFYNDISVLEKTKFFIDNKKLIKTIVDNVDNQLIRIYNKINTKHLNVDYMQNILYEEEYTRIKWQFDWGYFNMIITQKPKQNQNKNNKHQGEISDFNVIYEIIIDIIEDNKIINSRLLNINNVLTKINKIKSTFNVNNNIIYTN